MRSFCATRYLTFNENRSSVTGWTYGVRIPVGAIGSSRPENVQTGSGAHPTSH